MNDNYNNRLWIAIILIIGVIQVACKHPTSMDTENKQTGMSEEILQIHNHDEKLVAEIGLKDDVLDGKCIWYDRKGNILSVGYFKEGQPYSGTIINWSYFLPNDKELNPFQKEYYCQDWITIYEASYDSDIPDYKVLLETYIRGEKL